jgi:Ni,Fe-hydrogenase maturation factor
MSASPDPGTQATILVIGYGNEQRGDDAVGRRLAQVVATWELPDVLALDTHQLTPELASTLAEVGAVTLELGGHGGDPRALLGLAELLYKRSPRAWWLTIPASGFDFGAGLSSTTCRGMLIALRYLRDVLPMIRSELCTRSA